MSKKDEALAKNLSKIIEDAYEMGWDSLIITDSDLSPQGVVCGPKAFVQDFKSFTKDLKHLEEDLEDLISQNGLADAVDASWMEEDEEVPDIKNDDDDEEGGKTWH